MKYFLLIVKFMYLLGLVKTANRLGRTAKIVKGMFITHNFKKPKNYSKDWWDKSFYKSEITDKKTISDNIDTYSTAYHYASIELIITKQLFRLKEGLTLENILDIGSGAGHWINFYQRLGAKNIYGVDVSEKAIEFLRSKYSNPEVRLINGTIETVCAKLSLQLDVVNAIGVMFHIVDDSEWLTSLETIHKVLKPGGILIVGGHFGLIDGLNVQVDLYGVNKRLRSMRNWKSKLYAIGFREVRFIKNTVAYNIKQRLPENNILIAIKE